MNFLSKKQTIFKNLKILEIGKQILEKDFLGVCLNFAFFNFYSDFQSLKFMFKFPSFIPSLISCWK